MKKLTFFVTIALILLGTHTVFAGSGRDQGSAPSANAPVEITVEVFNRGTDGGKSDPTNNSWTKWIQEKLLKDENIAITFVPVARTEEITGLNNLMAAGTAPDICFTYTVDLINSYREQGGVLDMSPYVDTLLPDLKAFLGPDTGLPGNDLIRRYQDRETGKLYAIPAKRIETGATVGFIRKDWLDKLGLPIPDSTQQFYDTMIAFRDKDPGNVGMNRVIPFTMMTTNEQSATVITESFIDPNISREDRWAYGGGNEILQPGYKEGFRFLNKMYNAGLIDRDFPIHTDVNWGNIIKTGAVGAFTALWQRPYYADIRIAPMLKENVPGAEIVAMDAFKNAAGVTRKGSYDITGVLFFMPTFAKNPEAALRYMNWLAKFENTNFLQIGPEGITHDVVNGLPVVKPATGGWIMNSPNNSDYTIHLNGLDLGDSTKNAQVLAFAFPEATPEWVINSRAIAMKNAVPPPFLPVTLTAAQPYIQTLVDKRKAIVANVVTAPEANFDRVWDEVIADYLASGAQAMIDERRAKYFE